MSDTEKAVSEFLTRNGYVYNVTNRGERNRDGWQCDAWLCEFARLRNVAPATQRESFEYFTGTGHRKQVKRMPAPAYRKGTAAYEEWARDAFRAVAPPAASVLYSLILDSSAVGQSFESWCADYGYNSDSRKAEATYRACQENADKLARVFSRADIATLEEMLRDY